MSRSEINDPIKDPDDDLPAHEYADKYLLTVVSDAIQNKCEAFVFIYLIKEPGKDNMHEHIYQGPAEQVLFLLEYVKSDIMKDLFKE